MNQPDLAELERRLQSGQSHPKGASVPLTLAEAYALIECAKALEPFADFVDTQGAKQLPDEMPLTMGSNLATKQLLVRDFRRALAAFSSLGGHHGK